MQSYNTQAFGIGPNILLASSLTHCDICDIAGISGECGDTVGALYSVQCTGHMTAPIQLLRDVPRLAGALGIK